MWTRAAGKWTVTRRLDLSVDTHSLDRHGPGDDSGRRGTALRSRDIQDATLHAAPRKRTNDRLVVDGMTSQSSRGRLSLGGIAMTMTSRARIAHAERRWRLSADVAVRRRLGGRTLHGVEQHHCVLLGLSVTTRRDRRTRHSPPPLRYLRLGTGHAAGDLWNWWCCGFKPDIWRSRTCSVICFRLAVLADRLTDSRMGYQNVAFEK